jgi:glutamine amidotransferase
MVAIIDYKAGNAPSVLHAVKYLGCDASLVHHPEEIRRASHIILPGVGSARATMESLSEMGLIEPLEEVVLSGKCLFLGICVGLQIMFEHSQEEDTDCLGWLKGEVVKFDASVVRVPQMGWNRVSFEQNKVNFEPNKRIKAEDNYFYFVNSYYAKPTDPGDSWGTADYGGPFTAAVHRGNIYATQFHVEKSGEAGLKLLNEFLQLGKEV